MNMEISEDFSGSNVDQMITKGKRTKRPRPSSSASSSGGARGGGGEFCNSSFISSPTTSSAISTCTEEDEDMAKCLILLAHGGSPPHTAAAEDKFTSRKFTEMATTTIGKVGIYVYECKTCNRAFPSFQALGGHRASHKKPKTTVDIDRKKSPPPPPTPPEPVTPPPSSHIDHNKPKIHECSICGSEFGSGQALGGHMRRHRSAPPNETTSSSRDVGDHPKPRNMLVLDLNLPAPPEDEKYHQFPSKQPPPNLVFSAAALVDCHY